MTEQREAGHEPQHGEGYSPEATTVPVVPQDGPSGNEQDVNPSDSRPEADEDDKGNEQHDAGTDENAGRSELDFGDGR